MFDPNIISNMATTLARVEERVIGIDKRLDKQNHSQEKQWDTINESRNMLSELNVKVENTVSEFNNHCDNEGAHGAQVAKITAKGGIAIATVALISSILGGILQAIIH